MHAVQPNKELEDGFVWWQNSDGFSIRASFNKFEEISHEGWQLKERLKREIKVIYKSNIPSKIQVFSWRLLLNRISTRVELEDKGILSGSYDIMCLMCLGLDETIMYLFLSCPVITQV